MAYMALYRMYRPSSFDEVVGQKHIVKTLRNAIKNNRIGHAYLFCGPRGTGKTTIARIFAKAVNCPNFEKEPCNECESCRMIAEGRHPDIIEIDAASNNKVDEIRDLIEKVKYAPMSGKYKVYIIDEVHVLTKDSFNALLKTLEEPPEHVIFILATTDPNKVLPTVISRCQRYDFGKVSEKDIAEHILDIARQSHFTVSEEAARLIARLADGGMRDALSILDQCLTYEPENLGVQQVEDIFGLLSTAQIVELLKFVRDGQTNDAIRKMGTYFENGIDAKSFVNDCINVCKEVSVYQYTKDISLVHLMNEEEVSDLSAQFSKKEIIAIIDILSEANERIRFSNTPNTYCEIALIKMQAVLTDEPEPTKHETSKEPKKESKVSKDLLNNSAKMIEELTKNVSRETFGMNTEEIHKEEKISTEPTKEPEQKVFLNEDVTLDNETLLEVLVNANKQIKETDQPKWQSISNYMFDVSFGKYANLLNGSAITASSSDSLIISVTNKSIANRINNSCEDESILPFIQKVLGQEKYIFALTTEETKDLISLFRQRQQAGTLPEKTVQEKIAPSVSQPVNDTYEDRVVNLFGAGNVTFESEEG